VVFIIHAPWYNSNTQHQGDGEGMRQALEAKLVAAGVSVVVSGHVHSYERSFPVSNNAVVPPGPGGMTHLNIGDGGASLYTTWLSPQPAWSALRNATWGHGELSVWNATHAGWSWHMNGQSEPVVTDAVTILNSRADAWAGAAGGAA
jgi:hypothetical protein